MREQRWGTKQTLSALLCLAALVGLLFVALAADASVSFADPALEAALREALAVPEGPLTQAMLRRKAKLDLSYRGITSLSGIEYCAGLDELLLAGNEIADLAPLAALTKLAVLDLEGNRVQSLRPLAGHHSLRTLNLAGNRVTDIEPLARLYGLEELSLNGNPVGSLSPLTGLTGLRELQARACGLSDYLALAQLMQSGALQDAEGRPARVDIRENPLLFAWDAEGLAAIQPHWRRVTYATSNSLAFLPNSPVPAPRFSRPGGFYTGGFSLTLETDVPGGVIHYTLDGRAPDETSPRYEAPLRLAMQPGPQPIEAQALRGTMVRAVTLLPDGGRSNPASETYFLHPAGAALFSLPVVVLTTAPDYLFAPGLGIHTEENYWRTGGRWARPAHIAYYEDAAAQTLSLDIELRIHGRGSRKYGQKSLRLCAGASWNESQAFAHAFFPGAARADGSLLGTFSTLVLRNGGNDNLANPHGTLLRDAYLQGLVAHLPELDTQASRPVVVFLNGAFRGVYTLLEYLDAQYPADHHGVAPEDVAMLELFYDYQLVAGEQQDLADYLALEALARQGDHASDAYYDRMAAAVDLENLAAYYAAQVFFGNTDWPQNNVKLWRAGAGAHRRWRYLLFDLDYGFGLFDGYDESRLPEGPEEVLRWAARNDLARLFRGAEANPAEAARAQPLDAHIDAVASTTYASRALFTELMQNPRFRAQFVNCMARHLNSTFRAERLEAELSRVAARYAPEMPAHCAAWPETLSLEAWQRNVSDLGLYAAHRTAQVFGHVVETLALPGTVRVDVEMTPGRGHVEIGGLRVRADTPGIGKGPVFSGTFFQGVPVEIRAVAQPGYAFAGWEGLAEQGAAWEAELTEDLVLRPRFQAIPPGCTPSPSR